MDSDSPVTNNYFDNAYVTTQYCENITKVLWSLEEYTIAFTHNSSEIDVRTIQDWTAPDEEINYDEEEEDDEYGGKTTITDAMSNNGSTTEFDL